QDNALQRLAPIARELGVYTPVEEAIVEGRLASEAEAMRLATGHSVTPAQAAPLLAAAGSDPLAQTQRIAEVVKRQRVSLDALFRAAGVGAGLPREVVVTTELELKYAGYFVREREAAEKLRRMGTVPLDPGLPYAEFRS